MPHLSRLLQEADRAGFADDDQLFNVNRFSPHYKSKVMNSDQVEAMYRKLTEKVGVRMTPHRFRHTLATDLMKAPERNIHLTKCLLNHSNIQTTMSYIEADYDHMRAVLHARAWPKERWRTSGRWITAAPRKPLPNRSHAGNLSLEWVKYRRRRPGQNLQNQGSTHRGQAFREVQACGKKRYHSHLTPSTKACCSL